MDAMYGGDVNEQRIKAKMARLMRRRRLMTQRNDPLMNQRFLEIEREARRLGSAYLRLRQLRHAPSLVRNDRNSVNAHGIPIGGQSVNIPLPTSNEPNPTATVPLWKTVLCCGTLVLSLEGASALSIFRPGVANSPSMSTRVPASHQSATLCPGAKAREAKALLAWRRSKIETIQASTVELKGIKESIVECTKVLKMPRPAAKEPPTTGSGGVPRQMLWTVCTPVSSGMQPRTLLHAAGVFVGAVKLGLEWCRGDDEKEAMLCRGLTRILDTSSSPMIVLPWSYCSLIALSTVCFGEPDPSSAPKEL
ncbi:hypothetical protein RHMOL_Rhmol02G0013400 [Rhododendron molle]|nr:hypothetical protein RHMOL_Rhmol02G0013400 [Rhododendron molle]